MSWRALAYVQKLRKHVDGEALSCREKMILQTIAYFHNDESRKARPGFATLQEAALCSRMTVIRAIKSLEVHKTLIVHRFRNSGSRLNEVNEYFFTAFEVKDGTSRGREMEGGSPNMVLLPSDTAVRLPPSTTAIPGGHTAVVPGRVSQLCDQGSHAAVVPESNSTSTPAPPAPRETARGESTKPRESIETARVRFEISGQMIEVKLRSREEQKQWRSFWTKARQEAHSGAFAYEVAKELRSRGFEAQTVTAA